MIESKDPIPTADSNLDQSVDDVEKPPVMCQALTDESTSAHSVQASIAPSPIAAVSPHGARFYKIPITPAPSTPNSSAPSTACSNGKVAG